MKVWTDEEAASKWCPFSRAVRGDGVSGFNRGTDTLPDVSCMCIGSACMAWRAVMDTDLRSRTLYSEKLNAPLNSASGDDAEWRLDSPSEPPTPHRGICGLLHGSNHYSSA